MSDKNPPAVPFVIKPKIFKRTYVEYVVMGKTIEEEIPYDFTDRQLKRRIKDRVISEFNEDSIIASGCPYGYLASRRIEKKNCDRKTIED